MFIAHNPEWKRKISAEVHSLIQKHTDTTSSERLHQRLAAIPISAWEEDMPLLDLAIRETLRLVFNTPPLRRNIYEDLTIGGKILPKGHFLTYPVFDVHMNPDIYTEPLKFDPDRFAPGREEDKKEKYAYLAWGAGEFCLLILENQST